MPRKVLDPIELSPDDAERLRLATYRPLIANELVAAREAVRLGELPDDRLLELLRWLEEGAYPTPNTLVAQWVRLDYGQVEQLRSILAAEVFRRGGVVTANGFDWSSTDGVEIKAYMPGGAPR